MIARNSIFNTDCRQILPQIDDESVDVIFTDPPFNVNLKPQRGTHDEIDNDALTPEQFAALVDVSFTHLYRVLKPNRVAWICCNWQCYSIFDTVLKQKGFEIKTCIVWVKQNWGLGNHFRPQHEFVIAAFKGEPPVPEVGQSNVWNFARITNTLHPNEKPVDMIERALGSYNKAGDLMLDPFAGVFSSCVAAKRLGIDYIGCETKQVHFDVGKQRLAGEDIRVINKKGTVIERDGNPLLNLYNESMG